MKVSDFPCYSVQRESPSDKLALQRRILSTDLHRTLLALRPGELLLLKMKLAWCLCNHCPQLKSVQHMHSALSLSNSPNCSEQHPPLSTFISLSIITIVVPAQSTSLNGHLHQRVILRLTRKKNQYHVSIILFIFCPVPSATKLQPWTLTRSSGTPKCLAFLRRPSLRHDNAHMQSSTLCRMLGSNAGPPPPCGRSTGPSPSTHGSTLTISLPTTFWRSKAYEMPGHMSDSSGRLAENTNTLAARLDEFSLS